MNTHTIYTGPADGWHLTITARAALDRWALKFSFTSTSGRTEAERTTWSRATGWNPKTWHPLPGSEVRAIAEAWLRANPVPVPGAGVRP